MIYDILCMLIICNIFPYLFDSVGRFDSEVGEEFKAFIELVE